MDVGAAHTSPDGDEGYPGTLRATVTYTVTADNELRIEYAAATDRSTIVDLTHHSYFNLAGPDRGDILGHELFIDAAHFTPTDEGLIPSGDVRPVAGTPFDFTTPTPVGARIEDDVWPPPQGPGRAFARGGGGLPLCPCPGTAVSPAW